MTEEKKTCGDCPWSEPLRGHGSMVRCKVSQVHVPPKCIECHTRKAYRVLRDEVRRLRGIVGDVNFGALAAMLQEATLDDLRATGKKMVEATKPNNDTEG